MKIFCALLLITCSLAAGETEKKFPSVPKYMLKTTHRVCASISKRGTQGHGTAVAVDLSYLGFTGKRFLLTAAHVIEEEKKVWDTTIEVDGKNGEKTWIDAKVVAYDERVDVAILMVNEDLPDIAALAQEDVLEIGDALFAVGSPQGTAISANMGYLASKSNIEEAQRWFQASMAITHGNSGGPVFDPNREKVVGIIVALQPNEDRKIANEAPNVAWFAGLPDILNFLTANKDKIAKAAKK